MHKFSKITDVNSVTTYTTTRTYFIMHCIKEWQNMYFPTVTIVLS